MVTLTAPLTAASIQRSDTALHWLDEARKIATNVVDEPMVGVERGEAGGTMLDLAGQVTLDRLEPRSSRRAGFLADVGRGLARDAKTGAEAVRWLRRAEEAAPQRIRNSGPTRETVAYLLNRARAASGGRELRGMAARMGLPH